MGLPGFRSRVRGVSNHGGRPILRDGRYAMLCVPKCLRLRPPQDEADERPELALVVHIDRDAL
jgi:hypothetical protein